jgi:exodeoxyribonuclease III
MNITTYNVNSVRKRLERVLEWVDERQPDVLCLQEIKCVDEEFPRKPFLDRGYQIESYGQKTYNGVALLSRLPMSAVQRDLPWAGDSQARGIAAQVGGLWVVNLYVPNGGELSSEKYPYKLEWLTKLEAWLRPLVGQPLVVCGDFNIAPADADCYDAEKWKDQVLCTDAERSRFQALLSLGLSDGFRRLRPSQRQFTWWDYRGNQFGSNQGLRIDHHLISEALWPRVLDISVDEEARGRTEASDHAAVTLHLQDVATGEGRLPSPPSPAKQVGLFG